MDIKYKSLILTALLVGLLSVTCVVISMFNVSASDYKLIDGYVYDRETNEPVEGAKLEIYTASHFRDERFIISTTYSTNDGFFCFKDGIYPNTEYMLLCTAPGYHSEEGGSVAGLGVIFELVPKSGYSEKKDEEVVEAAVQWEDEEETVELNYNFIEGYVADSETIEPIGGAKVEIYKASNFREDGFEINTAYSNDGGSFYFNDGIRPDTEYMLFCTAPGYHPEERSASAGLGVIFSLVPKVGYSEEEEEEEIVRWEEEEEEEETVRWEEEAITEGIVISSSNNDKYDIKIEDIDWPCGFGCLYGYGFCPSYQPGDIVDISYKVKRVDKGADILEGADRYNGNNWPSGDREKIRFECKFRLIGPWDEFVDTHYVYLQPKLTTCFSGDCIYNSEDWVEQSVEIPYGAGNGEYDAVVEVWGGGQRLVRKEYASCVNVKKGNRKNEEDSPSNPRDTDMHESAYIPDVIFPPDGFSFIDRMENWKFIWIPVIGASKYNIHIESENTGDSLVDIDVYKTSYQLEPKYFDIEDDEYSFKVRAYVDGRWHDYSSIRYFCVILTPSILEEEQVDEGI